MAQNCLPICRKHHKIQQGGSSDKPLPPLLNKLHQSLSKPNFQSEEYAFALPVLSPCHGGTHPEPIPPVVRCSGVPAEDYGHFPSATLPGRRFQRLLLHLFLQRHDNFFDRETAETVSGMTFLGLFRSGSWHIFWRACSNSSGLWSRLFSIRFRSGWRRNYSLRVA